MAVKTLLSHLDKVRETKPGHWSACCPAHPDRNPSLAISIGDDDRVLLYCRAGCEVSTIVAAVGLTLSDLFPPRPITHAGPIPAHRRPRISDRDLLQVIRREVCIVAQAGEELLLGPLSDPDLERLRAAVRRLFAVLGEVPSNG